MSDNTESEIEDDIKRCNVDVAVIGFNKIEKTKRCVYSILKYTTGINYRLILVDSGSSDGTLEFFQSVEYVDKTVIRLEENRGLGYALENAWERSNSEYFTFVANDCIVTTNWLHNLLICMKSDDKIGMACPAMSNVSNAQSIDIGEFDTWEEMQRLAERHNVSDPVLWEERPRLINPVSIYRGDLLGTIVKIDNGFKHNFMEDDFARAIHRAGYRMILCKDTYVEHDHPQSDRVDEVVQRNLGEGRAYFINKYAGIDPWDDINNYIYPYLINMDDVAIHKNACKVLGIDIKCGTPFFDIRNHLKSLVINMDELELYALTAEEKYVKDLEAFPAEVIVGDICSEDYFGKESMDVVVTTTEIALYKNPLDFLSRCMDAVNKGGYFLFPVGNPQSILNYLDEMIGDSKIDNTVESLCLEEVIDQLDRLGADNAWIYDERYQSGLADKLGGSVGDMIFKYIREKGVEDIDSVYIERFWVLVKK